MHGQLQLHRGLALIGDPAAARHTDQRRHGVKEPAGAGRRRGVEPARDEPGDEPHVALPGLPHQRQWKP
jgi:hypothetical protein